MKKILFSLLIITTIIYGEQNDFEIETIYAEALERHNAGQFDEAIKLFNEIKKKGVINEYIYNSMLESYIAKTRKYIVQNDEKNYKSFLKETVNLAREAFSLYPDNTEIAKKYVFLLEESGNIEEMKKPLNMLIKNNKDDIVANFYLGVIEFLKRKYDDAEAYFLKVINSQNFNNELEYLILYKSYFNLGQLAVENNNYFDAIYYYEKAININPYDNRLLINLAIVYSEVLEFEKAIKVINKIPEVLWAEGLYELYGGLLLVSGDEEYKSFAKKYQSESIYLKALSQYSEGKYKDSLKTLEEITKKNPSPHFYIHYLFYLNYEKITNTEMQNKEAFLLGNKAEISEKLELAIKFYKVIEKNNAGKPTIYWVIGTLCYEIKNYDEAKKYFELYTSSEEATDYLVDSYIKLSYIYHLKKEKEKSQEYISKANGIARKANEKYLVLFHSGLINYDNKKYDMAIKNFEDALEFMPLDTKSLFFIGVSYYEKNDNKKSIEYLERALKLKENDPEINNLLAYVYSIEKINLDKAHNLVDKALIIKPDYLPYLDTKGWIYYNEGNFQKSFEIFNKVETLVTTTNEDSAGFDEIYYHLSKIYEKMGNKKESQKYIEKIKKNFPESKWAPKTNNPKTTKKKGK
ncbi:MAG: tetratricopeptide repeat protein [Brevinematales bacterium]|nr:tetratricopeptide repeat protein [Brevinematales bacterium]